MRREARILLEQPADALPLQIDRLRPASSAALGLVLPLEEVFDQTYAPGEKTAALALPHVLDFLRDVLEIGFGHAPRPQQLRILPCPLSEIAIVQLRILHSLIMRLSTGPPTVATQTAEFRRCGNTPLPAEYPRAPRPGMSDLPP